MATEDSMDCTMTMEDEMEWLQGDINHLMEVQNRAGSDVDDRGFPLNNHLSEEIGHLERVWGQLYDKAYAAKVERANVRK
jgi:hypothetical protein